jgi:hexosaminidase
MWKILAIIFCVCGPAVLFYADAEAREPAGLSVEWELLSNTYSERPQAKSEFVIRNDFDFALTDANWALYYNQRPARRLLASEGTQPVEVEWLSGDWYRVVPQSGFELESGEEVTITYEVAAWWIKEIEAPMGLYVVFYDDEGSETGIVTVGNYEVRPFERPEQQMRGRNEHLPLNTPEFRYQESEPLSLLDEEELPVVVPSPVKAEVDRETRIRLADISEIRHTPGLEVEAGILSATLEKLVGLSLPVVEGDDPGPAIIFLNNTGAPVLDVESESYRLESGPDRGIVIEGADGAGVFYGIQTLIGLLPVEAFWGEERDFGWPAVSIEDAPRFGYRGLLIDVARNFQTPETIKKILDVMAYYKLNTLHFYLTDDEGWRVEIEALPELTEVGGQRGHTTVDAAALHPSYGSGPFPYAEGTYGSGFYSREEFIEILRYAKERHIEVVPSINLPAHARAAIKSMEARFERLMGEGDEEAAWEFRLIDPEDESEFHSPQAYTDNVVNVAMESVYRFYETVLDELGAMYEEVGAPFRMMHIGGDEVADGAWAKSPIARKRMNELGIEDAQHLQPYYSSRTIAMLRERGLLIGGWEEIAQIRDERGRFVPNPEFAEEDIITYVWRNQGNLRDLAYRLANVGYPIVLSHRSNFYFDLAYNNHPEEPGHYSAGFVSTRDAWQYAPFNTFWTTLRTRRGQPIDVEADNVGMERLKPEARESILGLQAQVWSESVRGPEMIEYYLLPRLAAFAESAWAAEREFETIEDREEREKEMQRGWNIFANALGQRELPRMAALSGGFNYRVPAPGGAIEEGVFRANTKYPGLQIRYTTDGSEPTVDSREYYGPVEVSGPVKLKAFDRAESSSRTVTVSGE